MKKTVLILAVLVSVLALVFGVKYYGKKKWEGALSGPYKGTENVAAISREPFSSLELGDGTVEVYYLEKADNPVVVCRAGDGKIISQTSIIPSRKDENDKEETAYVKRLELIELYSCTYEDCEGVHVLVHCDWEWGGEKRGLLSVNDDMSFKEVWLSH